MKKSELKSLIREIIQEELDTKKYNAKEITDIIWGTSYPGQGLLSKLVMKVIYISNYAFDAGNDADFQYGETKDVINRLKKAGYSDADIYQIRDATTKAWKTTVDYFKQRWPKSFVDVSSHRFNVYSLIPDISDESFDSRKFYEYAKKMTEIHIKKIL